MSQRTYILCPGQGAQQVGMGKDFFDTHEVAQQTFKRASDILGFDLASTCFSGPEDRLNQTDISQPAIYVTSIAGYRSAERAGKIDVNSISALAGLSLGEYTALHLASVFSFEDGLKLVAARGKFMQQAATAVSSGMVAVLGADEPAVEALCADVQGDAARLDIVVPANFNAPGQIVVSGSAAACQRLIVKADSKGLKTVPLKVAGAFHSPLMQPAADRMAAELDKVQFSAPHHPVYANVTGAPHADVASIKRLLVDQIVKPVRWEQTMHALLQGEGATARWVELAPQRTLAGMLKRINRRLPIDSLSTADTLK